MTVQPSPFDLETGPLSSEELGGKRADYGLPAALEHATYGWSPWAETPRTVPRLCQPDFEVLSGGVPWGCMPLASRGRDWRNR